MKPLRPPASLWTRTIEGSLHARRRPAPATRSGLRLAQRARGRRLGRGHRRRGRASAGPPAPFSAAAGGAARPEVRAREPRGGETVAPGCPQAPLPPARWREGARGPARGPQPAAGEPSAGACEHVTSRSRSPRPQRRAPSAAAAAAVAPVIGPQAPAPDRPGPRRRSAMAGQGDCCVKVAVR